MLQRNGPAQASDDWKANLKPFIKSCTPVRVMIKPHFRVSPHRNGSSPSPTLPRTARTPVANDHSHGLSSPSAAASSPFRPKATVYHAHLTIACSSEQRKREEGKQVEYPRISINGLTVATAGQAKKNYCMQQSRREQRRAAEEEIARLLVG